MVKKEWWKKLFYTAVIITEWVECGEFFKIDRVVVVGDYKVGMLAKILLRKEGIKVLYCTIESFQNKYKRKPETKWLLTETISGVREKTTTDIVVLPDVLKVR